MFELVRVQQGHVILSFALKVCSGMLAHGGVPWLGSKPHLSSGVTDADNSEITQLPLGATRDRARALKCAHCRQTLSTMPVLPT